MFNIDDIIRHYETVIRSSRQFNSARPVTDVSLLYPPFRGKLQSSIRDFQALHPNIIVSIGETYRSRQLQQTYYQAKSSRTLKGTHHLGLAADVNVNSKFFPALRKIFVKNGLYILGNWDLGHVQFIPVSLQEKIWRSIDSTVPKLSNKSFVDRGQDTERSAISGLAVILLVGGGFGILYSLLDDDEEYE